MSGASAAIAIRIALGSSGGRPSLNEVRKGLFELGVPVDRLTEAATQHAGVFLLDGIDPDGAQLRVKVYGRDAWDAQLLAKAWRALWFRGAATLSVTRLQQVEHEGFLTLLAARNGVPVQDVVRAGRTVDNDAVIVMRVRGGPIAVAAPSNRTRPSTPSGIRCWPWEPPAWPTENCTSVHLGSSGAGR